MGACGRHATELQPSAFLSSFTAGNRDSYGITCMCGDLKGPKLSQNNLLKHTIPPEPFKVIEVLKPLENNLVNLNQIFWDPPSRGPSASEFGPQK